MIVPFTSLIAERNISWKWTSKDAGKSSVHQVLNRFVYSLQIKITGDSRLANHSYMSYKEKEAALDLSVDTFCRLVKQHANLDQLVTV